MMSSHRVVHVMLLEESWGFSI